MSTYVKPLLADRHLCPCNSGVAYKRCCKKVMHFRRRALRELLDRACVRQDDQELDAESLQQRFSLHLARRNQKIVVRTWLLSDLVALGHEVVPGGSWQHEFGAHIRGLAWRHVARRGQDSIAAEDCLARSLAAIRRSEEAEALEELLAVWKAFRWPVAADLIERLSGICGVAQLPDRWPERLSEGIDLLMQLVDSAPDPRVATALVELFETKPRAYVGSEGSRAFWALAFETWLRCGDTRTRSRMRRTFGGHRLPKSEEAPVREPYAEEQKMFEQLTEALDQKAPKRPTNEDLLQRIYIDPDDEAVRQVYADWLLEHDDPRGELIVLQTQHPQTEAATSRAAVLVQRHGQDWLGALTAVTSLREARFERGFVVSCGCRGSREVVAKVTGDASWGTVEQLTFHKTEPSNRKRARVLARLLGHEAMRSLRSVRGLQPPMVDTVAELGGLAAVEELVLDDRPLTTFCRMPSRSLAPCLKHLVYGPTETHAVDKRLLKWLAQLTIVPINERLASWQLFVRRSKLSCFRYRLPRAELVLTRGADKTLSALRVRWLHKTKDWAVRAVFEQLRELDPASLTRLVIEPTNNLQLSRSTRRELGNVAARFTTLQKLRLPWQWKKRAARSLGINMQQ